MQLWMVALAAVSTCAALCTIHPCRCLLAMGAEAVLVSTVYRASCWRHVPASPSSGCPVCGHLQQPCCTLRSLFLKFLFPFSGACSCTHQKCVVAIPDRHLYACSLQACLFYLSSIFRSFAKLRPSCLKLLSMCRRCFKFLRGCGACSVAWQLCQTCMCRTALRPCCPAGSHPSGCLCVLLTEMAARSTYATPCPKVSW